MARSRNIKPGFFKNEYLAELEPLARLLFAGLWCMADKEGRLEDRPKRIRAEILPYDDCDVDALLQSLHEASFIQRYTNNGASFIQIRTWKKHQTPHHKEVESEIPSPNQSVTQACTKHEPSMDQACAKENASCPTDSLNLIPDSLIPDSKQSKPSPSLRSDEFDRAWSAYPKRSGANSKAQALKAWRARIKAGADPKDMIAGVERYRRWCEITGKIGTEYVKQGVSFFGPAEHYLETWEAPVHEARQQNDKPGRAKRVSDKLDEIIRDSLAGEALDGGDIPETASPVWPQVDSGYRRN